MLKKAGFAILVVSFISPTAAHAAASDVYIITETKATALGVKATLDSDGLVSKLNKTIDENVSGEKTATDIPGEQTKIDAFATNSACPALVTAGMSACVEADVHQMRFSRDFRDVNGDFFGRVEATRLGVNYQASVALTAGQITQLKTFLTDNFCADFMTEVGASNCNASNVFEASFTRPYADPQTANWNSRAEGLFEGTWVDGLPDT